MKLLNFFNLRTIIVLMISQLAVFLSIRYHIRFDLNLTLFGLAISFPLAFSIQSAFRRRDKALEYFSLFKAGSLAIHASFSLCEDLSAEKKKQSRKVITDIVEQLISQLHNRVPAYAHLQTKLNHLIVFIDENREDLGNRTIQRLIRYYHDVSESSVYLITLVTHRTMVGPRWYATMFIMLFPFVQAPIMLNKLEASLPVAMIYLFIGITALTLVTLANFQKMIEYPFDEKGMDNIQITDFRLDV